ncbi:MAG TPA: hypothetical protein VN788_05155 [Verrucomicrobiae bacterium]|nr:hypothetical protein [Verrucomicrobiae bacterium]
MRNDKFGTHLTSGNGTGRKDAVARGLEKQQEHTRNLRFGIFYLVVGLLLFLAINLQSSRRRTVTSPTRSRTSA